MGYAFISYSSEDQAQAKKLRRLFEQRSIENWMAPTDIPAGARYAIALKKAIENCACFVLLLSRHAIASQWVANEVERAVNYKKPIITVFLEDLVLPDEFEMYISTSQTLSIYELDEALPETQAMLTAVQAYTAASLYTKADLNADIAAASQRAFLPAKEKGMDKGKIALIVGICAVLVMLLAFGISRCSKPQPGDSTGSSTEPSQTQLGTTETTGETTRETTGETTETTLPQGENQIPGQYQDEIDKLMNSDEGRINLMTIRVRVGEHAAPMGASVWENANIYSQDTAIAVGDGGEVLGVSPGETYIIMESSMGGLGVAYRVIVIE